MTKAPGRDPYDDAYRRFVEQTKRRPMTAGTFQDDIAAFLQWMVETGEWQRINGESGGSPSR